MTADELFHLWRDALSELELVDSGDRQQNALANTVALPLVVAPDAASERMDTAAGTDVFCAFIDEAYRAYAATAARAGLQGWFYAWHDEPAAELRVSAAWVGSPRELPFGGAIAVIDDPVPIALASYASRYLHGVPLAEVNDTTQPSQLDDTNPALTLPALTVYARRLPRAA